MVMRIIMRIGGFVRLGAALTMVLPSVSALSFNLRVLPGHTDQAHSNGIGTSNDNEESQEVVGEVLNSLLNKVVDGENRRLRIEKLKRQGVIVSADASD